MLKVNHKTMLFLIVKNVWGYYYNSLYTVMDNLTYNFKRVPYWKQ